MESGNDVFRKTLAGLKARMGVPKNLLFDSEVFQ